MIRTASVVLAALLLVGCQRSGALIESEVLTTSAAPKAVAAGEPKQVRIVSWNLEHFVDPYDDPYVDNEREDGSALKPAEQLADLAEAIRLIDADVLALQEVESDRAVKLFLDSHVQGHTYKYYACVPATEWYQNVVIASSLPIGTIFSLREREMTSTTGSTRSDINNRLAGAEILGPGDSRFLLANVHLKAGGGADNQEWRTLQVGLVKEFFAQQDLTAAGLPMLLVGDLNMAPANPEFATLAAEPVPLTSPFAEWNFPPTHPSEAPTRSIDHIFMNDDMAAFYVPDSAAVALPITADRLSKISDHLPVVATFAIPQ
jgi:endonuclease/exonuclease/phosphatase family metal-dependent hydrolase